MPHKLVKRKNIINKTTYHPQEPITNVFYSAKELLEFFDIIGMSYMQNQATSIAYVIIHRT